MSNRDKSYRKQLIFDIDTNVCEQILGKGYRKTYDRIEKFLLKNGFSHPQGSGYVSNELLSNMDVFVLTDKLLEQYPYLLKCIRDIRVADVGDINSLNHLFEYDGTPGKYAAYEADAKRGKEKPSLRGKLADRNKKAKQENQKNQKNRAPQEHNHKKALD